jgi:hypothetical protein
MADLILTETRLAGDKAVRLSIRQADCGHTEYEHVAYLSLDRAREIVEAGAPYWLHGDPAIRTDKDEVNHD